MLHGEIRYDATRAVIPVQVFARALAQRRTLCTRFVRNSMNEAASYPSGHSSSNRTTAIVPAAARRLGRITCSDPGRFFLPSEAP